MNKSLIQDPCRFDPVNVQPSASRFRQHRVNDRITNHEKLWKVYLPPGMASSIYKLKRENNSGHPRSTTQLIRATPGVMLGLPVLIEILFSTYILCTVLMRCCGVHVYREAAVCAVLFIKRLILLTDNFLIIYSNCMLNNLGANTSSCFNTRQIHTRSDSWSHAVT